MEFDYILERVKRRGIYFWRFKSNRFGRLNICIENGKLDEQREKGAKKKERKEYEMFVEMKRKEK
jgi:hypothetical protein